MEQRIIQQLIADYGSARWISKSIFGFQHEGWFILDTTPLPPADEVEQVVTDIIQDSEIAFHNGQVMHWPECKNRHVLKDQMMKKALVSLEEQRFRLAVCTGDETILDGQPLVIALQPTISLMNYPDHPHLNHAGMIGSTKMYLPDSFCYGFSKENDRYGPDLQGKFIRAFDDATLFLFRHQIWLATRNLMGVGKWIGTEHKNDWAPETFAAILNPVGRCRCGKPVRYMECHLPIDLKKPVAQQAEKFKKTKKEVEKDLIIKLSNTWVQRIGNPQANMQTKLKVMLK